MGVAGCKLRRERGVACCKLSRAELIRKIKKTQHGYFFKENSSLTKENAHPWKHPRKHKLSVLCKTICVFFDAETPINFY
jgi:hypothetical protein